MRYVTELKRQQLVFVLACVAAVALVFISEGSYWRSVNKFTQLGEMGTARLHLQSLTQSMLDAETNQRGFLLTHRPEYRPPYEAALRRVDTSLAFLDDYYRAQPQLKPTLDKLHELIATRLSELALTMRLLEQGKGETTREVVLSGIGQENMDAVRTLAQQLLDNENRAIREGGDAVLDTLLFSRIGLAIFNALCLLSLFMYLRQSSALKRQQEQQQSAIQAERDGLEREVAQRTQQLMELTRHLQTAREDERSRLARELHDELGALLTSAKLDAARIRSRLGQAAPEAQERLTHLVGTLNSGIALKRRIIEDLRPSALANLGLVPTLEILAREFQERASIEVDAHLGPIPRLEPTVELVIYRLVQEALTNIAKYAQARSVRIDLEEVEGMVEVGVRDDGKGFDMQTIPPSAHGLLGMRFRVEAEGGTLDISSTPGRGTRIHARVPANEAEAPPEPDASTAPAA